MNLRPVLAAVATCILAACAAALLMLSSPATDARGSTADSASGARYAVVYEANGGCGVVVGAVPKTGDPVVIQDGTSLSRSGYTFCCWNTRADGTGTAYAPGRNVDGFARAGDTVTLYAQWDRVD